MMIFNQKPLIIISNTDHSRDDTGVRVMFNCTLCHSPAHARSSYQVTTETKERYHQCTNINCGHTFVTTESFKHSIVTPGDVRAVLPHQQSGTQISML